MTWMKRVVVGASGAWIGFVILACTETDTEVEGDLASSGRCPAGESCAPRGGPRFFLAPSPAGAEPTMDELPPLATGARGWVRFVEASASGSDYLNVPGARIEVDPGLGTAPASDARTPLLAMEPGTFTIRAVDELGNLHDRTRIRVVDATELTLRPVNWFVGPIGPSTGWHVWPGTRIRLSSEVRSEDGELLVALTGSDAVIDLDVPSSGVLDVEAAFGDLTTTARLPVARGVDGVVGYAPLSCDSERRDTLYCLYGVEGGSPVFDAPLVVEDVDEDGNPYAIELTAFQCIRRDPEPRTVTLSLDGSRWTQVIPPAGDSCAGD